MAIDFNRRLHQEGRGRASCLEDGARGGQRLAASGANPVHSLLRLLRRRLRVQSRVQAEASRGHAYFVERLIKERSGAQALRAARRPGAVQRANSWHGSEPGLQRSLQGGAQAQCSASAHALRVGDRVRVRVKSSKKLEILQGHRNCLDQAKLPNHGHRTHRHGTAPL